MSLIEELSQRLADLREPLIIEGDRRLHFSSIGAAAHADLSSVRAGDVVALVGAFDAPSIGLLLRLIDLGAILVPLSPETRPQHPYFLDAVRADVVIEGHEVRRVRAERPPHPLVDRLRGLRHAGLVFFSSGSTGPPKAILHDMTSFLARYRTPRPALRTMVFLNFDHIGGINTLLHTLFNGGTIVVPSRRDPQTVLSEAAEHRVEVLPTTPTFLRLMLFSDALRTAPVGPSLRVVTYGTEPMDPSTLAQLCRALPDVDFRQTYGMSEVGILRVKSRARDSVWMQVGGEGVETDVRRGVLFIRSRHAMLGYLNTPCPFENGWYDTRDLVETEGPWIRITGRVDRVINVAGVKVFPQEIEQVGLLHPGVLHCRATGVANPITGHHVEVDCELASGACASARELREHFRRHLPERSWPARVRMSQVPVSHRFKRL